MPKKLSAHFTLEELILSQTAQRKGLDNTPPPEVVPNLKALCVKVLEPLRGLTEQAIFISSGYRSAAVNRAVKGARKSQHVLGEAADITCPVLGQKKLFDLLRKSGLPFDQVIDEFGSWVHVSYRREAAANRHQVLRARRAAGKVVYENV